MLGFAAASSAFAAAHEPPHEPADRVQIVSPEKPKAQGLPWADRPGLTESGAASVRNARRLLVGLEDSQLALLRDDESIGAGDQETLERILYRLSRLSPATLEQYRSPSVPLRALAENPSSHRFQIMTLRGRLRHLEPIAVPPEMSQRLEFDRYWRAVIVLPTESDAAVELYVRDLPEGWRAGAHDDDAVRVEAMFVKRGVETEGRRQLVFVGQRIGWLPDRVDVSRGITADHVKLASAGFDVSLFDIVRNVNGLAIAKSEREPFYQMLAAVKRLGVAESGKVTSPAAIESLTVPPPDVPPPDVPPPDVPPFEIAGLLQKPKQQHGRRMLVRGTARAVKRVMIDDEDLQSRFGLTQYFEVDVLVSLGDQTVRLGKEGPVLANSFPVTCCVLEIPAEWQARLVANGVYRLREEAMVDGYFYKLWGYRSEGTDQFARESKSAGATPLQVSPMFLAVRAIRTLPSTEKPESGTFLGTLFLAAMALVGVVVWVFHRSDARRRVRPVMQPVDFAGLKDLPAPSPIGPPPSDEAHSPSSASAQSKPDGDAHA